jgi:hypothetical protein
VAETKRGTKWVVVKEHERRGQDGKTIKVGQHDRSTPVTSSGADPAEVGKRRRSS